MSVDRMVGGSCTACGVAYKTAAAELAVMNASGGPNNVDSVRTPTMTAALNNNKDLGIV